MKKYWKLSTVIIASTMLISGGVSLLTIRATTSHNQQSLQNTSKVLQTDNVQIVNSVNEIELVQGDGLAYSSQFAIVRDSGRDRLYTWGDNEFGQLGLGDYNNRTVPTLVTRLSGLGTISYVARSSSYTLVMIDKRELWATGTNDYGQFCNGESSSFDISEFTKTHTFPSDVTSFSVGDGHVAAIYDDKLYMWGNNGSGRLGINDNEATKLEPQEVTALSGKTLGQVKCGAGFTIIKTGTNDLYLWGKNEYGQLGDGASGAGIFSKIPKLLDTFSTKEITNYYVSQSSVFVVIKNGEFSKLYAWGLNENFELGTGFNSNKSSPVEITLPDSVVITNMSFANSASFILTESRKVYSCGANNTGLGEMNVTTFTLLSSLDGLTQFVGGGNVIAVNDNQIYAFGDASYGGYGNGTTGPNKYIPIAVDPFSTPSSLTQKDFGKDQLAATVANDIYSSVSGFNSTNFKKYVSDSNFPSDATFSMTTPPVIDDAPKGTIKLFVTADKYYASPDGAKTLQSQLYEITLTGFKPLVSKINNLELAPDTKFNLNNIVSAMKQSDTNKVDMANFDLLFATENSFPTDNEFTISDDKVINNEYSAIIHASASYDRDSNLITDQTFNITINGLVERPDSQVIELPLSTEEINRILAPLEPGSEVSRDVLAKLINVTYFPTDAKFTIDSIDISVPKFTFTSDKIYHEGNVVPSDETNNLFTVVPIPVNQTDNTGLIIGLSIGGVLLLLMIIGLIIWYLKDKKKRWWSKW